jgi:crotonobetainyl-CoA:carnitine CoA-transferase CaiB-like acyl-CoA transferase
MPWTPGPLGSPTHNPLVGSYKTQDERYLSFSCLQAIRYWPDLCRVIGRPELAADERFAEHETLAANGNEAAAILRQEFASRPLAEWRERLADFIGQWAVVQTNLEAVDDPQAVANGYVLETATADGTPYRMVTTPVQFDREPSPPKRAPEFNEHGDDILAGLGLDWDAVVDLKLRGIVA